MDYLSSGMSSRSLVRKGKLECLERHTGTLSDTPRCGKVGIPITTRLLSTYDEKYGGYFGSCRYTYVILLLINQETSGD